MLREQWGRVRGTFDIDHFLPVVNHPNLALEYDNLLYACATCNAAKGSRAIPDPLLVLTSWSVTVAEDGLIYPKTAETGRLIALLGLNGKPAVEFRMLWIGIVALAAKCDIDLYNKLMGYPNELPELTSLRPPKGNMRPEGLLQSYHVQKQAGTLAETY